MSDYLVTPMKGYWKNWQRLAVRVGVEFSEEDMNTGQAIFGNRPNIFPVARPKVVKVLECFGPSDPSTFDKGSLWSRRGLSVHPVVLLTLMAGIGDEEDTGHNVWTYRTIASTLLLAHPSGKVYTFLLDGGEESKPKWRAKFLPAGEYIGRSMYIHRYEDKKGFNLHGYFVPDIETGKYGQFVTCF